MPPGPALAFCLEQTLGHRAHGLNVERAVAARRPGAAVLRVHYPERSRLPLPWAVRGSFQARQQLRGLRHAPDITLFHTSTISLAASGRYVVSVDATPVQVDSMGSWYSHRSGPEVVEAAKQRWYRSVFGRAAAMVAWSQWAADSLVRDYGVPGDRIMVAHPGAPEHLFAIPRGCELRKPRILFVGGDFHRKGGDVLLSAFAPLVDDAELVLMTDADVPAQAGVRVERGVRPGTERHRELFASADIFCLPTRGDCTSVAIEEAMAAGLAVVTTPVGSNAETIQQGCDGLLAPVDDRQALTDALRALVDDGALRQRLGQAARARARCLYDAHRNANRIIDLLEEVA